MANPRTNRTQSPMRNAPLLTLRPPRSRFRQTAGLAFVWLCTAFWPHCKRNCQPKFPFPLKKLPEGNGLGGGKVNDVIKGCKNHQHDDDCQPNPEPDLLGPLRQRLAAGSLDSIEQKVAAIEQRDRKQVEQPDRDR